LTKFFTRVENTSRITLIAKKQSKGFGGIVSFTLKEDTEEAAIQFVTQTNYSNWRKAWAVSKAWYRIPLI
jgi:cystathionine beta-lyase/cystathionine gamma-synthase